jgi:YD repeat-containing protein
VLFLSGQIAVAQSAKGLSDSLDSSYGRETTSSILSPELNLHATAGDPVDLYTGLYVRTKTDLVVQDTLPIEVQRTYRNADKLSRAFGIGTSQLYDMFLNGDLVSFKYVELILADGEALHYGRVSPGSGYANGVFEHTSTPSKFYRSRISWNGNGWTVAMQDGSAYKLSACSPKVANSTQCGVIEIRNPQGEAVTIKRQANGDIQKVVSPHGGWIAFAYDDKHRVINAESSEGKNVDYSYDGKGRLVRASFSGGPTLRYEYDDDNRLTSIFEPDRIVRNFYDHDLCIRQESLIQSKNSVFEFKYIFDKENRHTETVVIEPDGTIRNVAFNKGGYTIRNTQNTGKNEATLIYKRDAKTNTLQQIIVKCSSKHGTFQVTKAVPPLQSGETEGDYEGLLDLCTKNLAK